MSERISVRAWLHEMDREGSRVSIYICAVPKKKSALGTLSIQNTAYRLILIVRGIVEYVRQQIFGRERPALSRLENHPEWVQWGQKKNKKIKVKIKTGVVMSGLKLAVQERLSKLPSSSSVMYRVLRLPLFMRCSELG